MDKNKVDSNEKTNDTRFPQFVCILIQVFKYIKKRYKL